MEFDKAYITGTGLAGIAAAFYLTTDSNIHPQNITIFEKEDFFGGSLDAFDISHKNHYFMRGFRMLEANVYSAFFDFISKIPLVGSSNKSLLDDFVEFNREVKTCSQSRLIEKGEAINARPFKLRFLERVKILVLLTKSESAIENQTIQSFFSPSFFKSNFWVQFATTFSFQPWHSLEEFKRYILRFLQCSPVLDSQTCIRSTRYNQYDSVIFPAKKYLLEKGVNFVSNSEVTDIEFSKSGKKFLIKSLLISNNGNTEKKEISANDLVFLSLGSMTAKHTTGTMHLPPPPWNSERSCDWELWKRIAPISTEFGRPENFTADTNASKWVSFTTTFSNSTFMDLLEEITKTKAGREGPITIKDSAWLISFALPNHPHFRNQQPNMHVLWGYGMHSDKIGNFVKKTLPECTGEEILLEIIHHLKFEHKLSEIMNSAICMPCMLPYITSQFMPRRQTDRPAVVPNCAENFAFIGQYCNIPDDIVFTLEYSVRSAQIAVYTYLSKLEKATPIYRGWKRLLHIFNAFRTVFR